MKHIILLTHGELGAGIANSLKLILGEYPDLQTLSISLNETVEEIAAMVEEALRNCNPDVPTVLITDIPGGSTTQAGLRVLERHSELYLVTGLNLGLLVGVALAELNGNRKEDRRQLDEIAEQARDTIKLIDSFMPAVELDDSGEL